MVIAFIWDGNYPWDVRVEKICRSLTAVGHEVHLICRNTRREKRYEIKNDIHLHRLPYLSRVFGPLNNVMNFPFFFNPLWIKRIRDVVKKKRAQAIIVRDITLSLPAVWVGRGFQIPVLLDMAEPYPEMLRAMWDYDCMKLTDLVIRNPCIAECVEKYTLLHVDHVLAMVEESKGRLIKMGVPKRKISIVSNTPDLNYFRKMERTYPGSLATMNSNFKIIYIGYLTGSRGLQTAIKGMRRVLEKNANVRLIIVGTGKSEKKLQRLAKESYVGEAIIFEGWVDNKKLPAYVSSCDVGLISHYSCGLWDHTIPNKLFDYMATGIPVICSNVLPVQRIVEETGCGLIYEDSSPKDFSEKVTQLSFQNRSALNRMGGMGEAAVKDKYNWKWDFLNLLVALEREVAHRKRADQYNGNSSP